MIVIIMMIMSMIMIIVVVVVSLNVCANSVYMNFFQCLYGSSCMAKIFQEKG